MTDTSPRQARSRVPLWSAIAITLGVALAIAAWALTRQEPRLAGTNSILPAASVADLRPGQQHCQAGLLIPADTATVELFVVTRGKSGTPIELSLRSAKGVLLARSRSNSFRDGLARVPLPTIQKTAPGAEVCAKALVPVSLLGAGGAPALRFYKPGTQSLAASVPTIFHRASLFKPGWVGAWTFYAIFVLAAGAIALAALLLVLTGQERLGLRGAIVGVATVAFVFGLLWSLITPAFQSPDESAHYAYVETIALKHRRPYTDPAKPGGSYTLEQNLAVQYTVTSVAQNPDGRPPWTSAQEGFFEQEQRALGSQAHGGGGGYTEAAGYSPLYYIVDALPYEVASSGSVFTRLWAMRLISALMLAAAAVLAFLFARELAPSIRWFPLVAGLAVASQPMTSFMSGAVNNDALLILLFTLELYLLARALRRGLSIGLAAALGAVLALGIIAKPTMYALAPVAFAVGIYCLWRDRPDRRQVIRVCAAGASCFLALLAVRYSLIGAAAGGESVRSGSNGSASGFLSYTWQWYLPGLGFMHEMFAGTPPVYEIFLKGFWANFGHLDTRFADWLYQVLALASAAVAILCVVTIWQFRAAARTVVPRALLCLSAVAFLALLVNRRAYQAFAENGQVFAQSRYLLPAIAVFGAAIAGAAVAFGRQRGLVAGTIVVLSIACLNVFSMALVLTRFYS